MSIPNQQCQKLRNNYQGIRTMPTITLSHRTKEFTDLAFQNQQGISYEAVSKPTQLQPQFCDQRFNVTFLEVLILSQIKKDCVLKRPPPMHHTMLTDQHGNLKYVTLVLILRVQHQRTLCNDHFHNLTCDMVKILSVNNTDQSTIMLAVASSLKNHAGYCSMLACVLFILNAVRPLLYQSSSVAACPSCNNK